MQTQETLYTGRTLSSGFRESLKAFTSREGITPTAIEFAQNLTNRVETILRTKISDLFQGSSPEQKNLKQAVTYLENTFGKIPLPPELIIKLNQLDKLLNHTLAPKPSILVNSNPTERAEFEDALKTAPSKIDTIKAATIRSIVHSEIKSIFLTIYRESSGNTNATSFIKVDELMLNILPRYNTDSPVSSAVFFTCNAIFKLCHYLEDLKDLPSAKKLAILKKEFGTKKIEADLLGDFETFRRKEENLQY